MTIALDPYAIRCRAACIAGTIEIMKAREDAAFVTGVQGADLFIDR
jgi:hypothetical protein